MLPFALSILLVAAPLPHVVPGLYRAPHRAPDELLESRLPDAHVRIWQGFRSVQGGTPGADVAPASYRLSYIAGRCGKSENALSKALIPLKRFGWIEEVGRDGKTLVYRCHVGRDYQRQGKAYVACVLPEGKNDSACGEGKPAASCPTGRIVLPDGKDRSACGEDSPTPPNKESSYPNPLLNPVAADLEVEGEGEPGGDVVPAAAAGIDEGKTGDPSDPRNRAWALLTDRGVDGPVARRLAAEHAAESVEAVAVVCHRFDREGDKSPGWLVRAVERGFAAATPTPARQAATHTGRTPEQDRGSRAAAEAAREIATGELPGTPGLSAARAAVLDAQRIAEEAQARRTAEAQARRQQRRAARPRSAALAETTEAPE